MVRLKEHTSSKHNRTESIDSVHSARDRTSSPLHNSLLCMYPYLGCTVAATEDPVCTVCDCVLTAIGGYQSVLRSFSTMGFLKWTNDCNRLVRSRGISVQGSNVYLVYMHIKYPHSINACVHMIVDVDTPRMHISCVDRGQLFCRKDSALLIITVSFSKY